jgi:clan AA aspartic protease (TIGR02281 family)
MANWPRIVPAWLCFFICCRMAERGAPACTVAIPLPTMHLRCLALVLLSCALHPLRGADPQPLTPSRLGALRKSGLPAGVESVTLPFKSTVFGAFTVEVKIDEKPVQLVVDTGASCTVLSPESARKLGLQLTEDGDTATTASGGQVASRRALTRRISLGDAWTENEPVFVTDMIPGIDGLLGVATLADWDVRIDPSTKKLTLFPAGKAPPLEGETVLPLTCQLVNPKASTSNPQGFRNMNLRVPVRVGPHELLATPDTGHGTLFQLPSVLMEKVAPEAMKNAQPGLATSITLSGTTLSRETKLPEVTFGPDTLRGVNTDVINAPPGSSAERKGLIGLNLLRHYVMTFRFAARELRLKPLGTVQDLTRISTAGIHFDTENKILSVVPDGPADKAGLRVGDEVLEIEGHPLKTMTREEFAAIKRLPPGSAVKVRYRRGDLSPEETTLVLVKE